MGAVTGLDVVLRFNINGAFSTNTVTGSYVITPSDNIIYVNNTSGGAISMTLPASPATGQLLWIKDIAGNASSHNITIIGTVDGVTNPVFASDYQGAMIKYNTLNAWSQMA